MTKASAAASSGMTSIAASVVLPSSKAQNTVVRNRQDLALKFSSFASLSRSRIVVAAAMAVATLVVCCPAYACAGKINN